MDDLRRDGRSSTVRLVALGSAALTVAVGLGSRGVLPGEGAKVTGDVLYTVLVYALVVAAAPRIGPERAAPVALGVSWAVEFFQATGIPAELSRHSIVARLVLGTTFNVPDLFWYIVGAALGSAVHRVLGAGGPRYRPGPGEPVRSPR